MSKLHVFKELNRISGLLSWRACWYI